MELCKPSQAILLVGVAGTLYHLIVGDFRGMIWWLLVGIVGTGVFQGLCFGGLEPVGWVLMVIPVLVVCFFLAVALLASSMRIDTVRRSPCGRHHSKRECNTVSESECSVMGECRQRKSDTCDGQEDPDV